MRSTHCKGCGRRFAKSQLLLDDEKQYCRRKSTYSYFCNDNRCEKIRRILKSNPEPIITFRAPSHCNENMIKAKEKGHI